MVNIDYNGETAQKKLDHFIFLNNNKTTYKILLEW